MPLSWNRKNRPHREPPVGVVGSDHLARGGAPQQLTPIHRPDSIRLVRHGQPLELSTAVDWELEMVRWIDELHARGALDGGTYYVADEMIRTRLAAELALIDEERRAAVSTERGLLLGNDQANQARAQAEVAQLRDRDRELRAQIAEHVAELRGEPAPAVRADDAQPPAPVHVRPLAAPLEPVGLAAPPAPAGPGAPPDPSDLPDRTGRSSAPDA